MIPVVTTSPGPTESRWLDAPGGFVWWYVDLVDEHGDGLVLIVSFGLPFLPGLLDAARKGAPQIPRERPALSLAVYRGGKAVFYVLDVPTSSAFVPTETGDRVTLGGTTLDLRWEGDGFSLVAEIDAEGAGERITGTVRVSGRSEAVPPSTDIAHAWSLLCCATEGQADLRTAGWSLSLRGRAYVDRNVGDRPLDALGMEAWTWARVAFPDGDLVLWDVDANPPLQLALFASPDGTRQTFTPELTRTGSRFALGASAPRRIAVEGAIRAVLELGPHYEASPFYARFPVIATDAQGREGRGFAERCVPGRIDADWMRPFVRMRVQEPGLRSPLLPLFSGPAEGRLARFVRGWWAA